MEETTEVVLQVACKTYLSELTKTFSTCHDSKALQIPVGAYIREGRSLMKPSPQSSHLETPPNGSNCQSLAMLSWQASEATILSVDFVGLIS